MGTSRKTPRGIDETLREAIGRSGKSHYQIAKDAGVAPAQLDRFVAGERDLRLATAARVATALGLTLVAQR